MEIKIFDVKGVVPPKPKNIKKKQLENASLEELYAIGFYLFESSQKINNDITIKWDMEKAINALNLIEYAASQDYLPAIDFLMNEYQSKKFRSESKVLFMIEKLKTLGVANGWREEARLCLEGEILAKDINKSIEIQKELIDAGDKHAYFTLLITYMKIDFSTYENDIVNLLNKYKDNFLDNNNNDYQNLLLYISNILTENQLSTDSIKKIEKIIEEVESKLKEIANQDLYDFKGERLHPSSKAFTFRLLYMVKGKFIFNCKQKSEKNIYLAYKYFQQARNYQREQIKASERKSASLEFYTIDEFLDSCKTEEEKFLEPIVNVGAECPSVQILEDAIEICNGLPADLPFAMKRIFIEEFAEKEIFNLISNSKDLLEEGTITNLVGALNGYLQEEILEIEEKQALEKYPNLVAQKRAKVKQEKNYSQYSYQLLSGIERTLKNLFYDRFIDYLEQESLKDANIAGFYRNLKTRLKIDQSRNPKEHFDLGKFITLVGRTFNDQQQRIIEPNFLKWLKESSGQENEELIVEKLRSIAKRVDFIRDVIRNPIIHGVFAQKWTLVYSLNNALFDDEQNKSLISEVVEVAGFGNQNEVLVEP